MPVRENKSEYPKVLIVNTQSIYKDNATGITLRSLFSQWPKEKVMEVFVWKPRSTLFEECKVPSEQLPLRVLPFYYGLRKLMKKDCVYDAAAENISSDAAQKIKMRGIRNIEFLIKTLSECSPLVFFDKELLKIIDKFSPDVIYTLSGSILINRFVFFFAKRYNIRVVVHYMDNWRETAYKNHSYAKYLNRLLEKSTAKIEKKMIKGITISEKMATEYKVKYGSDFVAVMNCVDIVLPQRMVEEQEKSELTFTYAGGLHLGRSQQLLVVQNAIKSFNREGHSVTAILKVYTSNLFKEKYSGLFDENLTQFEEYVSHERIGEVYEEADVLIHIEAFERDIVDYTKYSLSTKIPEYMASGKPLLCYAPAELAVSEYISATKAGLCAKNEEELLTAINLLATDSHTRKRFGENGVNTAKNNHSKEVALDRLRDAINALD